MLFLAARSSGGFNDATRVRVTSRNKLWVGKPAETCPVAVAPHASYSLVRGSAQPGPNVKSVSLPLPSNQEGHFGDRDWKNHQTQADNWKKTVPGWNAKADQAKKAADSCVN